MGMGAIKLLASLFVWISLVVKPASSLYLHMRYTDRKCFIEEIPDDTMVTGIYKVELVTWNTTFGNFVLLPPHQQNTSESFHGLSIEVRNPVAAIVLSKLYGMDGRFTFNSYTAGEHIVCLAVNGTVPAADALQYVRVHLDITIGGMAVDYEIVRKKEKLTEVQLRVRKLMDLTDQIRKEQNYQRNREARFRLTSENTNKCVFWFAVAQTVMMIGVGYYQVRNLKEFFIQKKLV